MTKVRIGDSKKSREKCIWKYVNEIFTIFWEKYTVKYIYDDTVVKFGIPVKDTLKAFDDFKNKQKCV